MRKAFFFFIVAIFSVSFFGVIVNAETITKSFTVRWKMSEYTDIEGYYLYCGSTPGGPYTGISITGRNPLDIPASSLDDPENPEISISITVDTVSVGNIYCVITAYDANGSETSHSREISPTENIVESIRYNDAIYSVENKVAVFETATNEGRGAFTTRQTLETMYEFEEPVVIATGQFVTNYKEFVAIGKTSGTVWVIPNSSSGPCGNFSSRAIWLSNVNMDNIDAVVALDFDGNATRFRKDDIAVIDYLNGRLKIFLNTGSAFSSVPVGDYHATKGNLGEFSANAFQWAAAGDFTGNGCEDLALYAPSTRNVVVWESDCSAIVNRCVWAQGGSSNARIYAIDYNGDEKKDIMFFNFIGGAFSAWASNGNTFNFECVRKFSPGAFNYALMGNFIPWNSSRKEEFGIHAQSSTGNFVVFEYSPAYTGDPDPFKSRRIWINTTNELK